MTHLSGQHKTALLVIDMQKGVVAQAFHRDEVISNISRLVKKARAEKSPIIWVQHADDNLKENSEAWQLVPELQPGASEPIILNVMEILSKRLDWSLN